METDTRFWRALREQAEDDRGRLGTPPTPDEVLAFVEDRLEGPERERIADAIAVFPSAARLARDLARLAEAEPERGSGGISAEDAATLWRRIEARLEWAPTAGGREAPIVEGPAQLGSARRRQPTGAPRRPGVPWWTAVAAALVGVVVGVAGLRLADRDLPQPNPEILWLMPRGEGTTRGVPPERHPVSADAGRLVLILELAGPVEPGPYALALRDRRGRALWTTRDLRRDADGSFTILVPAGFLGPEIYTLEVRRTGASGSPPLAVYDLDFRRSATR